MRINWKLASILSIFTMTAVGATLVVPPTKAEALSVSSYSVWADDYVAWAAGLPGDEPSFDRTPGNFHLGSTLYRTDFQSSDGNLVSYYWAGGSVWQSGTANKGATKISLQPDGNVVIYNSAGRPLWYTGATYNAHTFPFGVPAIYRLQIQDDGNLVELVTDIRGGGALTYTGSQSQFGRHVQD